MSTLREYSKFLRNSITEDNDDDVILLAKLFVFFFFFLNLSSSESELFTADMSKLQPSTRTQEISP